MVERPAKDGYFRRLAAMASPKGGLYRDAHYLAAEVDVDADAARRWIPRPLRPSAPARATIFTAWFPDTSFGSAYREAGLLLHVQHRWTRAVFSPWMIVDDDVALILGREMLGYPKKMGEISFNVDRDRVTAAAHRKGALVLRMNATLHERTSSAPPILGRPHRNVRATLGLSIPKLIAFTPTESPVEVRRAEIELEVGTSDRDPIHELGIGRIRSAYLYRVDFGRSLPPLPIARVSPLWYLRQWLLRVH